MRPDKTLASNPNEPGHREVVAGVQAWLNCTAISVGYGRIAIFIERNMWLGHTFYNAGAHIERRQ